MTDTMIATEMIETETIGITIDRTEIDTMTTDDLIDPHLATDTIATRTTTMMMMTDDTIPTERTVTKTKQIMNMIMIKIELMTTKMADQVAVGEIEIETGIEIDTTIEIDTGQTIMIDSCKETGRNTTGRTTMIRTGKEGRFTTGILIWTMVMEGGTTDLDTPGLGDSSTMDTVEAVMMMLTVVMDPVLAGDLMTGELEATGSSIPKSKFNIVFSVFYRTIREALMLSTTTKTQKNETSSK